MVEVKNNSTRDALLQEIKGVIEEVHRTHPTSIEGYIEEGERALKNIKSYYKELYDVIVRLGSLGKLIVGCAVCASENRYDYYEVECVEERNTLVGIRPVTYYRKVGLPQGPLNFDSISNDLSNLHIMDTDILRVLGTEQLFVNVEPDLQNGMLKFFGADLGKKILGLISYGAYQLFMDGFEASANANEDYKPFRAMVHKYPRPEPFDEYEIVCYCYHDNTITDEEKRFITLSMRILKCKAMVMYDKFYGKQLTPIHGIKSEDISDMFSIPYIGYFKSLTTNFAKSVLEKQTKGLNSAYRNFITVVYDAFKKYILELEKEQVLREKPLVEEIPNQVKSAFDACETIEQKLALARVYAFDGKSKLVSDGMELLTILGIKNKKEKEMTAEERLLYYYILSLYYTRPVLRYIVSEPIMQRWSSGWSSYTGHDKLTFMTPSDHEHYDDIRYSCTAYMYRAIQNRKKFEALAKKMGVTSKKADTTTELYIETHSSHPYVEPILIAKYIEYEGQTEVIGVADLPDKWLQVTPKEVLKKGHYGDFVGQRDICPHNSHRNW